MSAAAPASIPPQFGVPPFTDEFEGNENNTAITQTIARATSAEITGVVPFRQTDVIYAWYHEITLTQTITKGVDTVTVSPYYPYTWFGQYQLNMQQQYPAISVGSLFDLVQITQMRPLVESAERLANYENVYTTVFDPATNLIRSTPVANTAGTQQTLVIPVLLPACVYFDAYWEMSYEGLPISGPHNGYVSPQDMAGYARVVTPDFYLNPAFASTLDNSPYTDSASAATATGTVSHRFKRIGVLGNTDPSVLPGPTNWQYNITHQRFQLAGRAQIDIPLNTVFMGQIMAIYIRMFDPAAAGALGAVITDSTVTNMLLQYGGNNIRFQGTAADIQRRFADQHKYLPPDGCMIVDLATDRQGWRSNAYLLNTLREAGVLLHLDFSATQSLSAYCEVVVEGLRWVPLTPTAVR